MLGIEEVEFDDEYADDDYDDETDPPTPPMSPLTSDDDFDLSDDESLIEISGDNSGQLNIYISSRFACKIYMYNFSFKLQCASKF